MGVVVKCKFTHIYSNFCLALFLRQNGINLKSRFHESNKILSLSDRNDLIMLYKEFINKVHYMYIR